MTAIVFFVLLFLGVPIAYVLIMASITYITMSGNFLLFSSLPQQLFSGIESYGLLAIPLFMLTGELMNEGGGTKRLIGMASILFGGFRGGLAYINLIANMMMASIMGSAIAQIAVMSKVMVPEMEKNGYERAFSAALTAAAGLLSPIIPPSMLFIIFGVLAQIAIGDMFIAGIVPGLMLSFFFVIVITVVGLKEGFPMAEKHSISQAKKDFIMALPAISIPVVIIGSILLGVATPTESAGIAVFLSLIVGKFFYKALEFSDLGKILSSTAVMSTAILCMIAAANIFGWVLVFEQIPHRLAEYISSLTDDPFVFMLLVNVLLLFVGMVLDGIAALILIVPILLPIAMNDYNINPIQFGVVSCINLVLGLLTPPVGAGLYVTAVMAKETPFRVFKALAPFLFSCLIVLILLSYFPVLTTFFIE